MTKFDNILNEFKAEVVGKIVPFNKVFDENNKIIPKEKLVKSEIGNTINQIVAALKKQGLINKFSADDQSTLDFSPGPKGIIKLTDDEGNNYIFKLSTGKVEKK